MTTEVSMEVDTLSESTQPTHIDAGIADDTQIAITSNHTHGPHCSHSHESQGEVDPVLSLPPSQQLVYYAQRNDLMEFQSLVARHDDSILASRDPQGHTIAHWVAQRGSGGFVEYLHGLGAPMDLASDDDVMMHPIHWACVAGNLPALKAFVNIGIDINTADAKKQRTPLLASAQNGHPLLVMFCIKHGADSSLVDSDRDSALHWAAYKGMTEIVAVLQYLGVNSDDPDAYGQTPLHLAAMRGHLSTVEFLVEELESDLNAKDSKGRTPLDLAVHQQFVPIVNYLKKQMIHHRWNILTWWESSRAPFYFTIVNLLLSTVLYVFWLLPQIHDLGSIYVPHLVLHISTCFILYKTKSLSPGNLSKQEDLRADYTRATEELIRNDGKTDVDAHLSLERPLCHTCHIQRPLRAKHCRVCRICVSRFDHHCPFVDNCVGEHNYAWFTAFVTLLTIDMCVFERVLYVYWDLRGLHTGVLFSMIYLGVLLLPVAHLFITHLYLSAKNLTTNEALNSHRYHYLRNETGHYYNPYDRGMVLNCVERFLPTFLQQDSSETPRKQRMGVEDVDSVTDTESSRSEMDSLISPV